jgi:cell division transport system permease protein
VRALLRHHVHSLGATVRRLARTPFAFALNALVIGVSLALPLGAWVLVVNMERLAGHLDADPQLSVFLATDATRADGARVEAALKSAQGVRSFRFVPKDEALAEMKRAQGLAELAGSLGSNPLPDAFIVALVPGDAPAAERLAAELRALPKVAHVQLDAAWIKRLEAMLRLGGVAAGLLAGLLALGLVAVTFNTVRLQILTQRDEIEVSKLIGATDAYVRRPFFYQGTLIGLVGGLAALALVAGSVGVLNGEVGRLAATYGSDFRLQLPGLGDLAAVLAFSSVLGWCGAWLSVSRHLSVIEPD